MQYLDPRLARVLSDIRLEQARAIKRRQPNPEKLRQRLGLWLIARGENLADGKPKAA